MKQIDVLTRVVLWTIALGTVALALPIVAHLLIRYLPLTWLGKGYTCTYETDIHSLNSRTREYAFGVLIRETSRQSSYSEELTCGDVTHIRKEKIKDWADPNVWKQLGGDYLWAIGDTNDWD